MKKTLLAAALMAGFAGIAQAETSVTLYGILDGGVGYQRVKNDAGKGTRTGMLDGVQYGNRWGLKGTEDLGNGLRAVFVLESGFNLGTGTQAQKTQSGQDRLFGRQATLGLAGDSWGQLDFGRQTNIASKYFTGIASPFGAGFAQANVGAAFTAANTVRYDNMIMYQTPNYSGFQFGVGYSFNRDGSQAGEWNPNNGPKVKPDSNAITTGLRYDNGPIGAAVTYDQFKAKTQNSFNDTYDSTTVKAWAVAFSYDFEVVKLHLGGGQTRDGLFAQQGYNVDGVDANFGSFTGAKGLRVNSYTAGLSAPVGAGTVMANWQMADLDKLPNGVTNMDKEKQNTFSLGYVHPLSKRTDVYAIGSYAKNVNFVDNQKATLLGVGLTHRF